MMINDIIKAISIALHNEFGDEYEIYGEEIRQGLKEPCFFISSVNPTNTVFLQQRYFRQNPFVVQYFPTPGHEQAESNDVAERLMDCLEYITVPGENQPIRGTEQHFERKDGVLHFFINYDLFIQKQEGYDLMETLQQENNVE